MTTNQNYKEAPIDWQKIKELFLAGHESTDLAITLQQSSYNNLMTKICYEVHANLISSHKHGDELAFIDSLKEAHRLLEVSQGRPIIDAALDLDQLLTQLHVRKGDARNDSMCANDSICMDATGRIYVLAEDYHPYSEDDFEDCLNDCKHQDPYGNRMLRNCNIYLDAMTNGHGPRQFVKEPIRKKVQCNMYQQHNWESSLPSDTNYIAPEGPVLLDGYEVGKLVGIVGDCYVIENGQEIFHLTAAQLSKAIGRKVESINTRATRQIALPF